MSIGDSAHSGSGSVVSLAELRVGLSATIVSANFGRPAADPLGRRLAELGFLPGEPVKVLRRIPGGEPLAVRIGSSTFALRRHEAARIGVRYDAEPPA